MKIKIKPSCGIKGAHVEAGASIDVEDHIANDLIAMGKPSNIPAVLPMIKNLIKRQSHEN